MLDTDIFGWKETELTSGRHTEKSYANFFAVTQHYILCVAVRMEKYFVKKIRCAYVTEDLATRFENFVENP